MTKNLPIGIQNIEEVLQKNYLYIDKTEFIYHIITKGKVYFLSRPRRFGKSLLISTLDAIFSGKKELFNGLWIESAEYDWKTYPVVRIDFTQFSCETSELLVTGLKEQLQNIAAQYNVTLDITKHYTSVFHDILTALGKIDKVVVLIDEYDRPLIHHLGKDIDLAIRNRDILREFYGILKGQDHNLKFVFLTGVSKFSKVGVFSGLNHLSDLTMDTRYADMLGITESEIEKHFNPYITDIAKKMNCMPNDIFNEIRTWYNGYQFSEDSTKKVYNPFSTLNMLDQQRFVPFWFETGTPSFLINLIKTTPFDFTLLEAYLAEEDMFSTYELENLRLLPLLVQTGYLTIKEKKGSTYTLGYPNFEVKNGFLAHIVMHLSSKADELRFNIIQLNTALQNQDLDTFFDITKQIFLEIPYDIQLKAEKYYQSLWYLIIRMVGLKAAAEYHTNCGRVDMVVETASAVYVFEMKINHPPDVNKPVYTVDDAITQIKSKGYGDEFKAGTKPVYFVGVVIGLQVKNIADWKAVRVN